jgi:apoptosis-inducing factor 2
MLSNLPYPTLFCVHAIDKGKIESSESVLIIGGGPTGVELAGEIVVDYPEKKVTLVHRGPRLLEFIGDKASKKCLDWLTSKKVDVLLQQSVDLSSLSDSDNSYKTSGGETVVADSHFVCIGKPLSSSWLHSSILKECLDNKGRLMVEKDLRVKGYNNIFAIGDITDIPVSLHYKRYLYFSDMCLIVHVILIPHPHELDGHQNAATDLI